MFVTALLLDVFKSISLAFAVVITLIAPELSTSHVNVRFVDSPEASSSMNHPSL